MAVMNLVTAMICDVVEVCKPGADMGSGNFSKKPLERRSSSTAALYQLLGPMPSPFLDVELAECSLGGGAKKGQGSPPSEALHYTPAQLGSPTGPGLERRRLSRKLTGGKYVCQLPFLPWN